MQREREKIVKKYRLKNSLLTIEGNGGRNRRKCLRK